MASLDPKALFNQQLIINGNMSGNITSASTYIGEARTIAAQLNWTGGGTPVGVFSIQCSNDNVNFFNVGTLSVSGNSGSDLINFDMPGFYYARLSYTSTSGSATGNGWLSAKS